MAILSKGRVRDRQKPSHVLPMSASPPRALPRSHRLSRLVQSRDTGKKPETLALLAKYIVIDPHDGEKDRSYVLARLPMSVPSVGAGSSFMRKILVKIRRHRSTPYQNIRT